MLITCNGWFQWNNDDIKCLDWTSRILPNDEEDDDDEDDDDEDDEEGEGGGEKK